MKMKIWPKIEAAFTRYRIIFHTVSRQFTMNDTLRYSLHSIFNVSSIFVRKLSCLVHVTILFFVLLMLITFAVVKSS